MSAASVRLDPKFSRSARVKRATLCRWFGHKPDPFEAWIGPAGADDEDGTTFDLCICGRCYVRVRGCGGAK